MQSTRDSLEPAPATVDPHVARKNGRVFASWDLAEEYGIFDADGTRPHFVCWPQEHAPAMAAGWKTLDDVFYAYWDRCRTGCRTLSPRSGLVTGFVSMLTNPIRQCAL